MIFQEKYFPCYILLTDQSSLSDCPYVLRYIGKYYVLQLFVTQGCDVKHLRLPYLSNQAVFLQNQEVMARI